MDLEAIFDGKEPAIPPEATPAEAPPPAAAEAKAEVVAAPEPPPEPPARHTDTERTAPLAALLDERDKRKAAEQRLAELEAAQRAAQQPQHIPDPYDDPQGYAAFEASQREQLAISLRFEVSETMARDKHGDDAVTAAMEWGAQRAQSDEAFRIDFLKQRNPIDWVVRQQKRDGLLSAIGDDPDDYVRRRAAEMGLIAFDAGAGTTPVPGQQQAPRPAAPPRSIASAASAGGSQREIATGPLAAMDALFKG